jgi:dUTP pyrophosphatase
MINKEHIMAWSQPTLDGLDAPVINVTLDDGGSLPSRSHPGDAGADLRASEDVTIQPGGRELVGTGVHIALNDNQLAWVTPRSGLAAKHGITIVNAPGLIDSGYRGEVKVCLMNTDQEHEFRIVRGDRIAQIVVQRYLPVDYVRVDSLDETDRGSNGFGSTGVN